MRSLLIPWTCGAVALLALPVSAQHRLPARTFEPSLAAVAPASAPPMTEWWRNGSPRIRPTDQRSTNLLRSGLERSSRLRALVETIEAAHVFVYLGIDRHMADGLAGRLAFVGNAGQYRYLRASISAHLSADSTIASLAHEMQHVVEVIEHPKVTSEKELNVLYQRIGESNRAGGHGNRTPGSARGLIDADDCAVGRVGNPYGSSSGRDGGWGVANGHGIDHARSVDIDTGNRSLAAVGDPDSAAGYGDPRRRTTDVDLPGDDMRRNVDARHTVGGGVRDPHRIIRGGHGAGRRTNAD